MGKKRTWTDEQLVEAVKSSESVFGVFRQLGLKVGGGTHFYIKKKIKDMGLDTSHFTGKGHNRGEKYRNPNLKSILPLDQILVKDSQYIHTSSLRKRLINAGVLINVCSLCGISDWQSLPITLQLDHINGIRNDNRIENIRLLCPNCHSQTDTFSGKNIKKA